MYPRVTILDGLCREELERQLREAQEAYLALSTGSKGEDYSYTQGDGGTKSVRYTRANLGALTQLILQLQQQLGIRRKARRPLRPLYLR